MQGPTENALMLVAAGNAYLSGRDITGFWPGARTFTFLKLFEFRKPPTSGNDADEYPLVAADPMAWFRSLKPWCRGLRLHHSIRERGPNQQINAPDRMLTAFVGGGARWLVEAVGDPNSQLWEGFHRLGGRDDPDRRIWLCTNILQGETPAPESQPQDLAVALSDLRTVLPEIEAFSREEGLENFAACFARAREVLANRKGDAASWLEDVRRHTGFSDAQLNVLQAINHAWVFGGMGSWNDTGGGARYDALSDRLYAALNDSIAGLANSTWRG